MNVLVRFPDNTLRDVEVTHFRTSRFSPPAPDMHAQFSDHLVVEMLGPDEDGCHYYLMSVTQQ